MPTYVNKCQECEHVFETVQRMSEDPVTTCPECGKEATKRIIQPAGGFRISGRGVHKPTSRLG